MSFYDEIEIEDMTYHAATTLYTYPCPCGDQFEISLDDLRDGEEVAVCPSCSLQIRVIFEAVSIQRVAAAKRNPLTFASRKTCPKKMGTELSLWRRWQSPLKRRRGSTLISRARHAPDGLGYISDSEIPEKLKEIGIAPKGDRGSC